MIDYIIARPYKRISIHRQPSIVDCHRERPGKNKDDSRKQSDRFADASDILDSLSIYISSHHNMYVYVTRSLIVPRFRDATLTPR